MPALAPPPIAGVSANKEATLETVYPSVAATFLGKLIGSFLSIPAGIPFTPLRLALFLVFGGIVIPFALLAYAIVKVTGTCFEVTNRSVCERNVIGWQKRREVPLTDIAEFQIATQEGYDFHRVGDVLLNNAQGNTLMTVPAIAYPQRFVHVLQEAREARLRSDETLKHINARG